jgi:DNA-directed RNA polymerase subunit omega
MARITVEDCLEKTDSQYDLVLLAKERTSQLNDGDPALVPKDNDKNTVIALREIGEGKVSIKTLEDSAINRYRKHQTGAEELEEIKEEHEDDFDKIYKGEISKSGTAILPSKRVRRMPEVDQKTVESSTEESQENKLNEKDDIDDTSKEKNPE